MKQFAMEKDFYTADFCGWPDEITVLVSDELEDQISRAKSIIKSNDFINMIDISVPDDFLPDKKWHNGLAKVDYYKITVTSDDFYYYVQCQFDARVRAEYCISNTSGDPL